MTMGRCFRALLLRLTDSVQFSSSAVYAHGPGIDHADDHWGSGEDQLHGAAEALCSGAVHHQPGRYGTGLHVDRRHSFAGGAHDAFPGSRPARIGEYISIYATGLGDVIEPARSRRR